MALFEVETSLIIHCKIKVRVEADSKDAAIDAAADLLPNNFNPDSAIGWKAKVELKAPDGLDVRFVRAFHFEQSSGADKAKRAK